MKSNTLSIRLPEDLSGFVQQQALARGFSTSDDFVVSLVEAEHKAHWRAYVKQMIQEGLDSGPATPMTKKDWQDLRRSLESKIAAAPPNHDKKTAKKTKSVSRSGRNRRNHRQR